MRCWVSSILLACLCVCLNASPTPNDPQFAFQRGNYGSSRSRSSSSYRSFRKDASHSVSYQVTDLTLDFAKRRISFYEAERKSGKSPLELRRSRRTYYRNFVKRLTQIRKQVEEKERGARGARGKKREKRPDPEWFNRRPGVKPLPKRMAWLLCRRAGRVACGEEESLSRSKSGNGGLVDPRGGAIAPLVVAAESKGKVVVKQSEREAGDGGFAWKRAILRGGQIVRSSSGKGGIIKPAVGLSGRKRLEGELPAFITWERLLLDEAKARSTNASDDGLLWNPEKLENETDTSFDDFFPDGVEFGDNNSSSPVTNLDDELDAGEEEGENGFEEEEYGKETNNFQGETGEEAIGTEEGGNVQVEATEDNVDESFTEDDLAGNDYEDADEFSEDGIDAGNGDSDDGEGDGIEDIDGEVGENGWITESDVDKSKNEDDVEEELESELAALQAAVGNKESDSSFTSGGTVARWANRPERRLQKLRAKKRKLKRKMKKLDKKTERKMKKLNREMNKKRRRERNNRRLDNEDGEMSSNWRYQNPVEPNRLFPDTEDGKFAPERAWRPRNGDF